MNEFNHFTFSSLITAIATFVLGLFVLFKGRWKRSLYVVFALYSFSIAWWCFCVTRFTPDFQDPYLIWGRLLHLGAILIPALFIHFVFEFLEEKNKRIIFLCYFVAGIFLGFNFFTRLFIKGITNKTFYSYPTPSIIYPFYFSFFAVCVLFSLYKLLRASLITTGSKRNQIKYLLWSSLFGYIGGFKNFMILVGLEIFPIYPYGTYAIPIYVLVVTYAILKYQLMDIKVAITRGGIFLFVYAFVLGIPFAIGYHTKSWFLPTFLMAVLASWGPFIYGRLRKKAEDIILARQRKYQRILLQAAEGMSRQRNLNHLLKLIVYIIKKTVNPAFAAVFFQENGNFYIKAARGIKREDINVSAARDSPLVQYIYSLPRPLNVEEMPPAARQYLENIFPRRIELVIPAFIEDNLIAFMVLGSKKDGTLFSASDMEVFEILSHQASLAIENCLLWEKERKRLMRREQELRMASLDHFSASLAHEIDNPIQAISGMAELALSHLDSSPDSYLQDKLQRIVNNSCRVSRMIKAIREFSSQTEGEHTILRIEDIISGFEEVILPQLKTHRVILEKEIERDLPPIKGNKIHLEEVLVNLASNSIHALEKKEKKVIKLRVYRKDPRILRIEFSDNGYGIEKKMLSDIFLDFVTTKASTEGQGLGLARVRKIMTQHSGRIWAESEGKDKGAAFFIELPLAG